MAEPDPPPPVTPRAGGEAPAALTVEETARRAGRYAWLEGRLFEVLGAWVPTVPEPEAKVLLATHGPHHAWHADLWRGRLPRLGDVGPDQLVVPGDAAMVAFVDALADPAAAGQTVEKLAGVYRVVVPRLVAAYDAHLAATTAASDGPTIRVLTLVRRDEVDHWRAGEALLESLLVGGEEVDRAAAHAARLERLLVAAGGLAGPSPRGSGGHDAPGG